jgi:hypothetical protein
MEEQRKNALPLSCLSPLGFLRGMWEPEGLLCLPSLKWSTGSWHGPQAVAVVSLVSYVYRRVWMDVEWLQCSR